jgi:hypothetical protein
VRPETSDTGYVGTWARGEGYARQTVSIVRSGDGYLFRPGHRSQDGTWILACGWDGRCTETVDGETRVEYTFRTWMDPASSHLMVECTGKPAKPDEIEIHYVDELVVEPGGRTIRAYVHERAGQRYEGDARPQYVFTKVADTVANPPGASR